MNVQLEQFLDTAYKYSFTRGPDVVRTAEEAKLKGLNCCALAHLVLKDLFDCQLPPHLKCIEMYRDREYFGEVEGFDVMQAGDLVWFGMASPRIEPEEFDPVYRNDLLVNWRDFAVKHVGIYTGDRETDYQILHANHIDGTNSIWPLAKFAHYERYRKIYRISRLVADVSYTQERMIEGVFDE